MAVPLDYLQNYKYKTNRNRNIIIHYILYFNSIHILLLLIPQHFLRNNTENCLVVYFTFVLHYLSRKMLNLMTVRRKYNRNLINFSVSLRSAQDNLTNYTSLSFQYLHLQNDRGKLCLWRTVKFIMGCYKTDLRLNIWSRGYACYILIRHVLDNDDVVFHVILKLNFFPSTTSLMMRMNFGQFIFAVFCCVQYCITQSDTFIKYMFYIKYTIAQWKTIT